MKKPTVFLAFVLSLALAPYASAFAQDKPDATAHMKKMSAPSPAQPLLDAGLKRAKKEKKAVLVMFHATWCGWCHKLEAVMAKPDFKKQFEKSYVIVNLDVQEHGEKVAQFENPGGLELMKTLGGEKSGLPFYAFLDAKGEKIGTSNAMPNPKHPEIKDQNIGYPGAPEEISAFMELIKKTAPKWSEADQLKLQTYLKENAPK